jgi:hypothetical protein
MVYIYAYLLAYYAAQRLAVYFPGTLRHLAGRGPDSMPLASILGYYLGLALDMFSIYKQRVLYLLTIGVTREDLGVYSG